MQYTRAILISLMLLLSVQSMAFTAGECFMNHGTTGMQLEHEHCGDTAEPPAASQTNECGADCQSCVSTAGVSSTAASADSLIAMNSLLPPANRLHDGLYIELPLIPPIAA